MPQETSLEDMIANIRSSSKLYKLTSKVREHLKSGFIDKATKIKKGSLPAFVPSAQVMGGKGHDNIIALTGLCFIDIDKITDEEIQRIKVIACNDEHTLMVNQSVSGNGIHILSVTLCRVIK